MCRKEVCLSSPNSPSGPASQAPCRAGGILGGEMGKISRVTPSWWGFSLGKSGTDFEALTAFVHSMNQTQVWKKSIGLGLQELNRDFRDSQVSPLFFDMIVIKPLLPQAKPPSSLSSSFSFECHSFAFLQQMTSLQKVFSHLLVMDTLSSPCQLPHLQEQPWELPLQKKIIF